jgi:hypothetical protein
MRNAFASPRRRRSPIKAILLLLLAVLAGFLIYLGLSEHEEPLAPIEQDVTNEALAG